MRREIRLTMKFFTKSEIITISIILTILFLVTGFNMSISLRKGRDATRKNDLAAMQKAIDTYYQKFRMFPLSTFEGKIIGCFNDEPLFDKKTGFPVNAVVCEWGQSKFENVTVMPRDPNSKKGSSYLYKSDGKKYELYVSLEGKDEPEYTEAINKNNLQCGNKICNYGRWSD